MTTDQTPDTGDVWVPKSFQQHQDEMQWEVTRLRQTLTEAEAEIDRLQSLNTMLGANVDALDVEVGRLRDGNANLIRNAEILADELIHATAERDTLAAQLVAIGALVPADWEPYIEPLEQRIVAYVRAAIADAANQRGKQSALVDQLHEVIARLVEAENVVKAAVTWRESDPEIYLDRRDGALIAAVGAYQEVKNASTTDGS